MFFEFAFSHKRAGMASPEIESTLHAEVGPKTTEMAAPNTEHYEQSPYILWYVEKEREDTGDCGRGSVSLLLRRIIESILTLQFKRFQEAFVSEWRL